MEIKQILEQELSLNPHILMEQLVKIEAIHSHIVELKREAMIKGSKEKGLLSDYQKVLEKKLSLGQTLLGYAKEEVKRELTH